MKIASNDKIARFFGGSKVLTWIFALNLSMTLCLWILRIICSSFGLAGSDSFFVLSGNLPTFLTHPWTLLTYMVTQVDVLNLLFNLLWIYWLGHIVVLTEGDRRLAWAYIGGGITGGLFFLAGSILSVNVGSSLVGPSAAMFAVTVFAAVKHPDYRLNFVLLGPVRLKWVAIIFVALVMLQGSTTGLGGQLAHAGGIVFGVAYALAFRKRPVTDNVRPAYKIKVKSKKAEDIDRQSAINAMSGRLNDSERLDELLDKVRISGYDSLSPEEKRELNAISSRL